MTTIKPPRIASWVLQHLAPSSSGGAALAGDLCEEFYRGRTRAWYWRQVITAVLVGYAALIVRLRMALVFAMVWSAAEPFTMSLWYQSAAVHHFFNSTTWLPFPLDAVIYMGLSVASVIFFLWAGFFVYLFMQVLATHSMEWQSTGRALATAAMIKIAGAGVMIVTAVIFVPRVLWNSRPITFLHSFIDPGLLLQDLPAMLALFVAIAIAHPVAARTQTDRSIG